MPGTDLASDPTWTEGKGTSDDIMLWRWVSPLALVTICVPGPRFTIFTHNREELLTLDCMGLSTIHSWNPEPCPVGMGWARGPWSSVPTQALSSSHFSQVCETPVTVRRTSQLTPNSINHSPKPPFLLQGHSYLSASSSEGTNRSRSGVTRPWGQL